jgi:hypothetical protein
MQSSRPKAAPPHRRSSTGNDGALHNVELSDQFARRPPPLNAARAYQDRPNEPFQSPPASLPTAFTDHAALKYP